MASGNDSGMLVHKLNSAHLAHELEMHTEAQVKIDSTFRREVGHGK